MLAEAARFRDFEALMHAVGIPDLYGDFIEPTAELLEQQAASLPNRDGAAPVLNLFNDDAPSSQLTYSFKVGPISNSNTFLEISFAHVIEAHHQCVDEVKCRILRWLFARHGCPDLLYKEY